MSENFRDFDQHEEPTFNYEEFLYKCLHYRYLFVVTIFLALLISFFFNKYARPEYEVRSTVLIRDYKETKINPADMLGIGKLNSMLDMQNEIEMISSYNLAERTIRKCNYEVTCFSRDKFLYREFYRQNPAAAIKRLYKVNPFYSTTELFNEAPFLVIMDTTYPQPVNMRFDITILSPTQFRLDAEVEGVAFYDYSKASFVNNRLGNISINKSYRFNEIVQDKNFRFKVILNENFDPARDYKKLFSFMFRDYGSLVADFRSYTVAPVSKESSVVEIKMKGIHAGKAIDFVNKLTSEYIMTGLQRKNIVATLTINFIDRELMGISDSLNRSERGLMDFRTTKKVMNLDAQAQQVFDKMMQLQDEKAVLMVKNRYLKNMKSYIETNTKLDQMIVPAAMGIENSTLTALTQQLTTLYMKRSESALYAMEKSPNMIAIDNQIETTKRALYENTLNAINSNQTMLDEVEKRMTGITSLIDKLPETQRELFGIERRFKLIDASYTYLLQKRSEALITRAANTPDNEIVDKAPNAGIRTVFPNKKQNYIIALLLGIILPILYIFGKDYFNKMIQSREDVEKLTTLPFLGNLLHSQKGSRVVIDAPNSTSTEAFRTVRTNINYLLQRKEQQTILITSDMVGAGKTFVSVNLASIFALYGKKTLLMGFDLRKPRIFEDFKLTNTIGISSFLINKNSLEEVIQQSGIDNLDILMAGPVPPNPAELIASEKCAELFIRLKEIYEYIIIDTPPVALVTDATLLMKHSDANIFVVRQGVTHKKIFSSVIRDMEAHKTQHLAIVLNDVTIEQGSYGYGYGHGYGYGYGHGYGYGYGYYSDDLEKKQKKGLLRQLFPRPEKRRSRKK